MLGKILNGVQAFTNPAQGLATSIIFVWTSPAYRQRLYRLWLGARHRFWCDQAQTLSHLEATMLSAPASADELPTVEQHRSAWTLPSSPASSRSEAAWAWLSISSGCTASEEQRSCVLACANTQHGAGRSAAFTALLEEGLAPEGGAGSSTGSAQNTPGTPLCEVE
eukprot:7013762-Prymnesium_polylepis.1